MLYFRICSHKNLAAVFLQVIKSEKPSFHIAFELLFLHGGLQLFVRPDVTWDYLQVYITIVSIATSLSINITVYVITQT